MKRSFQRLSCWWFATMVPQHAPLTTIQQRETMRKRRLLSLILVVSFLLILLSTTVTSVIDFTPHLIFGWLECSVLLLAFWLNRHGFLLGASLLLFLPESGNLLLASHSLSLSSPISVLWTLSPLALLLVMAGLFLPAWMILLMGMVETLVVVSYLLLVRSSLLATLLPAQQRWNFLVYLVGGIATSAMIGIFYMLTTQKALIQADRAADLERAHWAIAEAYRDLETAHVTIQRQALTDALTDLPNHRAIVDQLHKELDRTRRYSRPFSLLFFDADRFKRVNDTHSHAVGDAVLQQIGERASGVLRGGETVGRFGGEEFVVLLPEANGREARRVAERIRAAVASEPMATSQVEGGIAMTVSIGLSTYPGDGDVEQELLAQADEAMYVAKRLGRNQVRTAEDARQMGADTELLALLQQGEQDEATQREGMTLEHLRETYTVRVICSLLSLLERRDQNMCAHAHAVSDLATSLAQKLGLSSQEVARIGMAALLHDIGKIAVPDSLLQKAEPLSPHERVLLQEHAELGARILEASPFLYDLMPAVLHHHEHWDGNGYPAHLGGEDIPKAARIIAVAEACDFMQRAHPYRARSSPEEALAEVWRGAGTQFDPAVVQALQEQHLGQEKQRSLQIMR